MSQHQTMEEVSVEDLLNRYNLIVPEIQREYVWGNNPQKILTIFCEDIRESRAERFSENSITYKTKAFIQNVLPGADDDIRENLQNLLKKSDWEDDYMNIGFLYSYKPNYNVFNDTYEDINLIDGQQRITTLFLLLFYFAIQERRKVNFEDFLRYDKSSGQLAFDYRVRSLTHNFLVDLIAKVSSIDDIAGIKKTSWFLSNYHDDPTISAMVSGLILMESTFRSDKVLYYDFLKTKVRFWHFRTEETFQGEELYITMNSRGQQLADNENVRGKLFEPARLKKAGYNELYWSERWEIWQDFFWRHRNKQKSRSNADAGFNEFLRWIQIIRMVEMEQSIADDDNEEALDKKKIIEVMHWPDESQYNVAYLDMTEIDLFFGAIKYLYEDLPKELSAIKKQYKFYSRFDLLSKSWIRPDKALTLIDLYKLLPALYFVKKVIAEGKRKDPHNIFRLIRFFHNSSLDDNIGKSIGPQTLQALLLIKRLRPTEDVVKLHGFKAQTIVNKEEKLKLGLIKDSDVRVQLEDLCWMAEDMINHNGSILFLINWTLEETKVFDFKKFKKMLLTYRELRNHEEQIRADLIVTRCYELDDSRARWKWDYFKLPDFLQFAYQFYKWRSGSLDEFLEDREKTFLKQYKNIAELLAESGLKKQIYIYYLLSKWVMTHRHAEWNWNNGKNFAKLYSWEIDDKFKNNFNSENFIQMYNQARAINMRRVIWLQTAKGIGTKKFERLLEWRAK
jgi:hypothetical protein